jgi:cytoskeletal protein CcmA (bactofilin family)
VRSLLVVLGALAIAVTFLATPKSAAAAEFKTGDSPEVAANDTIDGDLYITGGTITIAGRVTGDVLAAGGEIDVSGQVDGSLQILAGDVEISGDVGGAVRALAGDITISGEVGRDVVVGAGNLTVQGSGSVNGDVVAAGGDVELLGPVGGDVTGNFGSLTINNRIGGDVDVTANDVNLLSQARIQGDFQYSSREVAGIAVGATVSGETEHSQKERFYPGDNIGAWLTSGLFRLFCALVAGLILVMLMPRALIAVADAARTAPVTSFLLGLVLILVLPILFLVLLITIVGAPIGLIGFGLYFSVLYLSQVFLGLAIGRLILPSRWDTNGRGYNLLAMVIGVLIIGGVRLIPVSYLGGIVAVLTALFGLGAFAVAVRAGRRPVRMPSY